VVRAAIQEPDGARAAVQFCHSPVFEGRQNGAIGVQVRAMQILPAVPNEIEFLSALEQGGISRVPSVEDLAFHIDEEWTEYLAVIRSKEGQARLSQRPVVNRYTALISRAADFVGVRPVQIEHVFDVGQRLRNDPVRKALGPGNEIAVADGADEEQEGCRQEEYRSAQPLPLHRGSVGWRPTGIKSWIEQDTSGRAGRYTAPGVPP
jgi:hypothetical protein